MIACRDSPAMVDQLVALDGQGRIKRSLGRRSDPLAEQAFRRRDANGNFVGDLVTRADETEPGEPLLVPMLRGGELAPPL